MENYNIQWTENKSSAVIALNTYPFKVGEVKVVGYQDQNKQDIMVGIGIVDGMGPEAYRVIIDEGIIVVAEVLDHVPDVSYYVFDQRYLVKDLTENKLYLTRRYKPDDYSTEVEKIELLGKAVVHESSSGNLFLCNPPECLNLFDLATRPGIINIRNHGFGDVSISISQEGVTYDNLHFVNQEEKVALASIIFDQNFNVSIESNKISKTGFIVDTIDPCEISKTIFTLTATYSGENVRLTETPVGWEWDDEERVYTKTVIGNKTVSSGDVLCKYSSGNYDGEKIARGVTSRLGGYMFLMYTEGEIPEVTEIQRIGVAHLIDDLKGTYVINPPRNKYTWFCFQDTILPKSINQFGVRYVLEETETVDWMEWRNTNLGTLTLYRSGLKSNGGQQEVNIE